MMNFNFLLTVKLSYSLKTQHLCLHSLKLSLIYAYTLFLGKMFLFSVYLFIYLV